MSKNKKISRFKFLKLSAASIAAAGASALAFNSDRLLNPTNEKDNNAQALVDDTKNIFLKFGTCSHTLLYVMNREFGYTKANEEFASDPLAGGIMNTQHQCGMLWGATLAVGAESYRRNRDVNQAIPKALTATQYLVESFRKRAKSVNCNDITGCDFSNKFDVAKYMLKNLPGGFTNVICVNLSEKWAPEAIQSAKEGLSHPIKELPQSTVSCASVVAKALGASNEEAVMVAGFAGGIGLSGNACGALGAAIWLNTLAWCRENPGKSGYGNPDAAKILKAFKIETGSEFLCSRICGKRFKTVEDHSEFVNNGGCDKVIKMLVNAS